MVKHSRNKGELQPNILPAKNIRAEQNFRSKTTKARILETVFEHPHGIGQKNATLGNNQKASLLAQVIKIIKIKRCNNAPVPSPKINHRKHCDSQLHLRRRSANKRILWESTMRKQNSISGGKQNNKESVHSGWIGIPSKPSGSVQGENRKM